LPPGSKVPGNFSRPTHLRLNRSSEFLWVKKHGRSVVGPFFRISAAHPEALCAGEASPSTVPQQVEPTSNPSESRLGIITTRRIGNAVIRARCRRRIRELHRLQRAQLQAGYWIVVIARSECASAPWKNLQTEWLRLLGKLTILRPA
jgi:ribonuclease P protein component